MKKSFLLLIFGFILFTGNNLLSQNKTLVYKISHVNTKSTSYLFGTMHVMSEEFFFFPKQLEEILSNCDALCLEVKDVSKQSIDPKSLFDSNKPLKEFCTEEQWDSIIVWAEQDLLMSKDNFEDNFKFAKPFILIQFMLQSTLPIVHKSHEKELENIAENLKLDLNGLETIEEQLNIFNQIAYPTQIEMLMSQLRDLNQSKNDFNTMEGIYNTQNLDSLCAFSETDIMVLLREELLVKRNLKWIAPMKTLMKNKSVFFAVGAAHLCGQDGLIELLTKEGFQIEGVKL